MSYNIGERFRNISNSARWAISAVSAVLLLGATVVCSMTGLLMMTFATDACSQLPRWVNSYFILPPALMVLSSFLAPLLFGLRQRWVFVLGGLLIPLPLVLCFILLGYQLFPCNAKKDRQIATFTFLAK